MPVSSLSNYPSGDIRPWAGIQGRSKPKMVRKRPIFPLEGLDSPNMPFLKGILIKGPGFGKSICQVMRFMRRCMKN